MKILILSDSHGNLTGAREALRRNSDAECVIFLGDGISDFEALACDKGRAYFAVRGNCDFSGYINGSSVPRSDVLDLLGKKIFITHGDAYGVKSGTETLLSAAVSRGADIVLFGHTHVPHERYDAETGVYLFNPGSISREYGGGSFGILTLTNGEPLFSHGKL